MPKMKYKVRGDCLKFLQLRSHLTRGSCVAHTANEGNVALNVSVSVDSRVRGKQCVPRKNAPSGGLPSPATACLMMSRAFYKCMCEGANTRCAKTTRIDKGHQRCFRDDGRTCHPRSRDGHTEPDPNNAHDESDCCY